ncbi:hypothetical protein L7F22_034816 [Adiantum nelumboides]|nr:hypothetical protein [Adiantum nelumboides]
MGHKGIEATLKAMDSYFYSPKLTSDVEMFMRACTVCQKMDFIFDLPWTQNEHHDIWTIVDKFSKQTHFVPVKKTIKADHMAKLFIAHIFKYHGIPSSIVLDRDPKMTSLFWQALCENLGTTFKFSSFCSHTKGQSKITKSIVMDQLRCYVSDRKSL